MLPQKTALNQSSPSILDYSFPHHYFQNKAQHIVSNAWWLFKRGDNSRSSFVRIARRWLRPLDRGCHLVRFITGRLMEVHLYIGVYWTQEHRNVHVAAGTYFLSISIPRKFTRLIKTKERSKLSG